MSYFTDPHNQPLFRLYPSVVADIFAPYADATPPDIWKLVPRGATLENWLRILPTRCGHAHPWSRRYRLVYAEAAREPAQTSKPYTVTVNVHGFLDSISVGETGTWDLTADGAPHAKHFVKLVPGGYEAAFTTQAEALADLEIYVMSARRRCDVGEDERQNLKDRYKASLSLTHRVFIKIPRDGAMPVASGPVGPLGERWRKDGAVRLGRKDTASIMAATPADFQKGDFVQATLKIEIEGRLTPGGEEFRIHHTILQVIRIVAKSQIHAILPAPSGPLISQAGQSHSLHEEEDEIDFAVDIV